MGKTPISVLVKKFNHTFFTLENKKDICIGDTKKQQSFCRVIVCNCLSVTQLLCCYMNGHGASLYQ